MRKLRIMKPEDKGRHPYINSNYLSIDIGLTGGIAIWNNRLLSHIIPMPTNKILIKKAVTVFKYKDKKKVIKTGSKKGERPTVIKTPAKYRLELDIKALEKLFRKQDFILFEDMGFSVGSSVSSVRTSAENFGRLKCICELNDIEYDVVRPHIWKKFFNIGKEKKETLEIVSEHFITRDMDYFTKRGKLKDGEADAVAIGLYHLLSNS